MHAQGVPSGEFKIPLRTGQNCPIRNGDILHENRFVRLGQKVEKRINFWILGSFGKIWVFFASLIRKNYPIYPFYPNLAKNFANFGRNRAIEAL